MPVLMKPDTETILTDAELVAARDVGLSRLSSVFAGQDDIETIFVMRGDSVETELHPGDNPREKVSGNLDQLAEPDVGDLVVAARSNTHGCQRADDLLHRRGGAAAGHAALARRSQGTQPQENPRSVERGLILNHTGRRSRRACSSRRSP